MIEDIIDSYKSQLIQMNILPNKFQLELLLLLAKIDRDMRRIFRRNKTLRGLYLYGDVGRGKSMLVDLFFRNLACKQKTRLHFHQFMNDVQHSLNSERISIEKIALQYKKTTKLLLLDELEVMDVGNAIIIARLFTALMDAGIVVIFTSNFSIHELYKESFGREYFAQFAELIERHFVMFHLCGERDYRIECNDIGSYYIGNDYSIPELEMIEISLSSSRSFKLRAVDDQEAYFSFAELISIPFSAKDYSIICQKFSLITLTDIPAMNHERRNEARRLINFIDEAYEARVRLVITAETEPENLYIAGDGARYFARTASRMRALTSF